MPPRAVRTALFTLSLVTLPFVVTAGCDSDESGDAGTGSPQAGAGGEGGPSKGGTSGKGGTPGSGGDETSGGGGASDDGGSGGSGEGGRPDEAPNVEDLVGRGKVAIATEPRAAFGAVIVASDGERVYAVESRRDIEAGPVGLPWRSRFRLAAYDAGALAWELAAAPDDVVSDVVVHPSGDVTVAVLHHPLERRAYDLVRLDRNGEERAVMTLDEPETTPDGDFGTVGRPLFRMKSDLADATVGGWVRLAPDGEGLVVAFLSYVDRLAGDVLSTRFALGVETFEWRADEYVERWARVVEGPHGASPAAWTYDELRWRDQAIRPFLTRDASTGDVLVGRAWNNTRCQANREVFAEFSAAECVLGSVGPTENERLPLAVTRFDADGARLGTIVLAPDDDAAEQLPFTLVARDGTLAVAGSVVRKLADGSKRIYRDPSGDYVDYDGYVAVYDAEGTLGVHHDFNLGRGDVLAALRFTDDGIVGVGSAGWDRWQGGMSISRGSDPLVVFLSLDGRRSATRVFPLSDGFRHFNLHDVTLLGRSLVAHGFSDAPMTHSADGGNDAARTFGPLRVQLSEP